MGSREGLIISPFHCTFTRYYYAAKLSCCNTAQFCGGLLELLSETKSVENSVIFWSSSEVSNNSTYAWNVNLNNGNTNNNNKTNENAVRCVARDSFSSLCALLFPSPCVPPRKHLTYFFVLLYEKGVLFMREQFELVRHPESCFEFVE